MFEFHKDRIAYFHQQTINAEKYVIPFIEETFALRPGMRVMEVGSGEGGVLKAFTNRGCIGVGVELVASKVDIARQMMAEEIAAGKATFSQKDIYLVDIRQEFGDLFDLIVLKDVIEHIHDQERCLQLLKTFLKPGGAIYFGFPPWQMPFGGHQQVCRNKLLSTLPYYHLLPRPVYAAFLRAFGQEPRDLLEIKDTGISIERFERIVKRTGYRTANRRHYLINPIYEFKFKLKPREQFGLITHIPYLRNFVTTCVYYLIQPV
nr:class I SAM-dependent methyltransferase [uncultured Arsenicibacter sp.]